MSTTIIDGITYAPFLYTAKVISADNLTISPNTVILANVTIDGQNYSVTNIDYVAFANCSNLISVTIPLGVTNIEDLAFANCAYLTSVTIPSSVSRIGSGAFSACSSLFTVVIENPAITSNIQIDSFTDVSQEPGSNITFNNTSGPEDLSPTWQTISQYYATQTFVPAYDPSDITTGDELIYFLSTDDENAIAIIQNALSVTEDLINDTNFNKFITNGTNNVTNITKN